MQQLTVTSGALFALLVVALVVVGSYWFTRSNAQRRVAQRHSSSRQASSAPAAVPGLPAQQLQDRLAQLLKANAGWNEIQTTVNPSNSASVAADLLAIRGPHMFAPAVALQVLQEGCRQALARNAKASAAEAVHLARLSMEQVTRYGD